MQRLIDAGLIGAERAAALQHQGDAITAFRPPAMRALLPVRGFRLGIHFV
jgi:hypothetical protein